MKLILTLDYELFGDGSGNIFDDMVTPTENILKICNNYGIKITIFFEVIEYWAIKEEWNNGNNMGYKRNPIIAIENQLRESLIMGHDIQLHFHPQWLNANYKNNKWELHLKNWRMSSFKTNDSLSTLQLLQKGNKTVSDILQPIHPFYSAHVIRAGGYNVIPSKNIVDAMKASKFKADSSVYPGGYENGYLSQYDYRRVPLEKDFWYANEGDLSVPAQGIGEILEIPIFSLPLHRWKKFGMERLKSILKNRKSAIKNIKGKTAKITFKEKALYLLEKEAVTWDYCLFTSKMHDRYFDFIENELKGQRETFVLVGHPKNFTSGKTFDTFLKLSLRKDYDFITINEYVKILSKTD